MGRNPWQTKYHRSRSQTVCLYKNGWLSLSPDLAISRHFKVQFYLKRKQLRLISSKSALDCRRVWYSNSAAKSPLLSISGELLELGIRAEKAAGVYRATRKAKEIIVDFSKKVR